MSPVTSGMPSLSVVRAALSPLTQNRVVFFTVMSAILVVKLVVSAMAPASADMVAIIRLTQDISSPDSLGGPWLSLYAQMLGASNSLGPNAPQGWWNIPPDSMPAIVHLLLLALRAPVILFDAAVAVALYYVSVQLNSSKDLARLTSLLWFINPYATFALEMLGVPDIGAALLTLVSLWLLNSKRLAFAGLALGGAIALKLYPILIVPALAAYAVANGSARRSWLLMVGFALLGFLAYFMWGLQVGLLMIRITLIEYTPVTTPMKALFDFTPQARVSVATFALVFIYFLAWASTRYSKIPATSVILPVLLVYYALSDPYPQYLIWTLPFLTIDVVLFNRRNLLLLSIISLLTFGFGLLVSVAYKTPSGYSLLIFPLVGEKAASYSQSLVAFLGDLATSVVVIPVVRAILAATAFVYALEFLWAWFTPSSGPESLFKRDPT